MTAYTLACDMKVYNTITNPLEAAIVPLAPIACFPLTETTGTVAQNIGSLGSAANGTISGVTLNAIDGPGGTRAPYADGVNDWFNLFSTALASAVNMNLVTVLFWCKLTEATLTDAAIDRILSFYTDSSNKLGLYNTTTNYTIQGNYKAGATDKYTPNITINSSSWYLYSFAINDTANTAKLYVNTTSYNFPDPGTWSGALTVARLAVYDLTFQYYIEGYFSSAVIMSAELTSEQIQATYAAGQETGWTTFLYNSPVFVCDYAGFTLTGQDVTLTYAPGTVVDVIGSVAGSDAAVYAVSGSDAAIYAVSGSDAVVYAVASSDSGG